MSLPPAGFLTANKPLPHSEHIFGTKSTACADANATIRAATERLGPIAHMHQVHGNRLVYAENSGLYEDCDAIYTAEENLWLAVKTADCVPVLLSSPHAVAAIHLGWRSTQADLLPHTIQTLCHEFPMTPEDIHIALGPCLCQPNFEVEKEFQHYFNVNHPERFFTTNRPGHVLMDLPGIIRAQALKAGVLDIHVHTLKHCTFTESDSFHSYRRDKAAAGRQISFIRRQPSSH